LVNSVLLPLKNANSKEQFDEILDGDLDLLGMHNMAFPEFEQRDAFVAEVINHHLSKSKRQMDSIRKGICEIIPESVLSVISWDHLEQLVCGQNDIDIEMLQRHTEYSGIDSSAPHIKNFWQVLREFSAEQRCKFVEFAYGQSRIPSSDEEFTAYPRIRMLIKHKDTSTPDEILPRADT
jgi:hypothetical protein